MSVFAIPFFIQKKKEEEEFNYHVKVTHPG
jgi:hypothetical protein